MRPWELHPALIHFPIAFLLAGLLTDLAGRFRRSELLTRAASGLLLAGVLSGIAAAAAGVVSYFTVPAHTEASHEQMETHLVLGGAAVAPFALVASARWRRRRQPASAAVLSGEILGSALLVTAAFLGGKVVYHGGAGVDPRILAPAIVQGHHHHDDGTAEAADHHDHDHSPAQMPSSEEPAAHEHSSGDEGHQHAHTHAPSAARRAPQSRAPLFDPDEDLAPLPASH